MYWLRKNRHNIPLIRIFQYFLFTEIKSDNVLEYLKWPKIAIYALCTCSVKMSSCFKPTFYHLFVFCCDCTTWSQFYVQTQLFHNKNNNDLQSFVECDVCPSCFQPLKVVLILYTIFCICILFRVINSPLFDWQGHVRNASQKLNRRKRI